MQLKPGVNIIGIRPEMQLGVMAAWSVYLAHGRKLVITSALDSEHSATSLHYTGCAVDLRIRDIDPTTLRLIVRDIKTALPDDFDVILEHNHIHIEFQPRYHG